MYQQGRKKRDQKMSNTKTQAKLFDALQVLNRNGFIVKSVDLSSGQLTVMLEADAFEASRPLTADEVDMCYGNRTNGFAGGKIGAIKSVRARLNLGLADAKHYVETHFVFVRMRPNF